MVNVAPEGGGGIGPLQKHPANPGGIRTHATNLATQAGKAIDQKAITDRAFNPATDNWDGIAAPELRTAPEPVRQNAHDLSSQLAWAAVPLNYWAQQVESFNTEVDKISTALTTAAGSDGHYGATGADGKPPTGEQINTAKSTATSDANTKWHTAYNDYIVSGSTAAAGMFKDGPTDANVKLAKSVGALPTTPGVFTVYPTEWHQTDMERQAHEAAELAKKINEPGYDPSEADLEKLDQYLKNQTDPAFATKFLNELGAKGLLQLTINVADFQADIGHKGGDRHEPPDESLAALMASVQSGLGAVLATGTKNVGERNQVSIDWMADLIKAGDDRMESTVDGGPSYGHEGVDLYGFQALGVLMSTDNHDAKFSSLFLSTIGDRMISFEQEHGGSKVWEISDPNGLIGAGYRLNWINGYDQGTQAGFDPVTGLMTALKNDDPDVSKQWFTHVWESDQGNGPISGGHLSMVKYLLTEREWPPDLMYATDDIVWRDDHRDYVSNGLNIFGEALDNAATKSTPDTQQQQLTESIVWELAHDKDVTGAESGGHTKTFGDVDVVPPSMRDSVSHIVAYHMNGVYNSLDGGDATPIDPKTGDQDPYTPGVQRYVPHFGNHEISLVLADLGKDKDAYSTVTGSAVTYATLGYDHYLHGNLDGHGNPGVTQVSTGLGRVTGALDFGAATAHHTELSESDSDYNDRVDGTKEIIDAVAGKAIGKIPVAGDVVDFVYGQLSDEVAESLKHDSTGQANFDAGVIQADGRQLVESTYSAAVYHNATGDQIPPQLREGGKPDGAPIPMDEWDAQQKGIWESQLQGTLAAQGDQRTNAGSAYDTAFGSTRNGTDIWAPGK